MKLRFFCVALSLVTVATWAQEPSAGRTIDQRVEALLGQMTLEEKLGQLQQSGHAPGGKFRREEVELTEKGLLGATVNLRGAKTINDLQRIAVEKSRLKIPLLCGFDVIHGYRTMFPVPLAMASSWDPSMAELSAHVAATESAACGVKWTFTPMLDIARDPRWGRIVEGAGEDPYLASVMARAQVRGFQGDDLSATDRIAACAKHWLGYGAAEGGRDYNTTEISEGTLREIYAPPFQAAADAGVATFMAAFNDLNGVPASGNAFLLRKLLREEWNYPGMVVSDAGSVRELITHGVAADEKAAAWRAFGAGVDMEMGTRAFNRHIPALVNEGVVTRAQVDEAVRRVLKLKFRLGLFDHPFVDEAREQEVLLNAKHVAAARSVAGRSMVLLKNERNTLPLGDAVKTIAVIGPLAEDRRTPLGPVVREGREEDVVTLLAGIKARAFVTTKVVYAKGCEIEGDSVAGISEAVTVARSADVIIAAVGEGGWMSGEAACRASLDLPGRQLDLLKALVATGKPVVVVLMNGRPLTIGWVDENAAAILETWMAGVQAGNAIADVLFGDVNPGGKLPVTFPRRLGQVPLYYNHKHTGRPPKPNDRFSSKYLDVPETPLYAFGFGLSYTQFELSGLQLSAKQIRPDGRLEVSVSVENTGQRAGDEVVQLYLRDVVASRTRPVRELKGCERITLQPGEKRQVMFALTREQLGFYNPEMQFVVEPGQFQVFVGNSSVGGLEGSFDVVTERGSPVGMTHRVREGL